MDTGMVFCRGCGKNLHSTAPACPHCGALQHVRHAAKPKSRVTAGVLALLLGGIGVHRFYLGQWWGLFYLLFCWTYIPSIVAGIEGIVFLCRSDESWDAKYDQGIPRIEGAVIHSKRSSSVATGIVTVVVAIPVIGVIAAITIPQIEAYRTRSYISDIKSDLFKAADAQKSFYGENISYLSCVACTSRDLPGYKNNPKIRLNAQTADNGFVLIATHDACVGSVWIYDSITEKIAGPSNGCKNAPSY